MDTREIGEVTWIWRKFHNQELLHLYSSMYIIRAVKARKQMYSNCLVVSGDLRNAYRILVRKPEVKIPLGRATCVLKV
jgi:hypothetical protein